MLERTEPNKQYNFAKVFYSYVQICAWKTIKSYDKYKWLIYDISTAEIFVTNNQLTGEGCKVPVYFQRTTV